MTKNCSYVCCGVGLLLPVIDESPYSRGGRAFLYLVGLLYSFLGVAIAAEVFMIAIEKITSSQRKVKDDRPHEVEEEETMSVTSGVEPGYKMVNVWNPTVANLTLMALGSSAPEILLSCIEIVGGGFEAGKLGPGTIVGSAAFNLLCITGVCISSIASPGVRRIDAIWVFAVTAGFCVFAYIWLLIILMGPTKNQVDVWEAFLTLLWFPLLVVLAYVADRKLLCKGKGKENGTPEEQRKLKDILEGRGHLFEEMQKKVARENPEYDAAQLARVVANRIMRAKPRDRLHYRIQASRYFEGNRPLSFEDDELVPYDRSIYPEIDYPGQNQGTLRSRSSSLNKIAGGSSGPRICTIEFAAKIYAFTSEKAQVKLKVVRTGRLHRKISVHYNTVDGSARATEHYLAKSETLVFKPQESVKVIDIELVPEGKWDEKDGFFIHLHLDEPDDRTVIGACQPAIVRYAARSGFPTFSFKRHNFSVKESLKVVRLAIDRQEGSAKEEATVFWYTEDITAHDGKDYEGGRGELKFEPYEIRKFLDIPIIDDKEEEKTETFKVTIEKVEGGKVGDTNNAIVGIISDDTVKEMFIQMDHMIPHLLSKMEPGAASWKEQIVRAISVNNGDFRGAKAFDIVMHILSFPFKVTFALVPPVSIFGGWLTFFVALALIGLLTAIVGDLASIFGCLVKLRPEVTAITLVALGTSLPDTFASRLAAMQEPTADNAIGNVTGSNSVNVFLGLGLPWLIAAIYWESKGKKFKVPAGALGFSVAIYTVFSVACIGLLMARRFFKFFGKGELGGPTLPKWLSAVICLILWLLYVLLSSLQSYCIIPFAGYTCEATE